MAAEIKHQSEYGFSTLKSGKPGKAWVYLRSTLYCEVVHCEKCGKPGNPVWVRRWYYRPWEPYLADYNEDAEPVLCMGCANRLWPLWKSQCIILENHRLINKIKREISRVNAANRR